MKFKKRVRGAWRYTCHKNITRHYAYQRKILEIYTIHFILMLLNHNLGKRFRVEFKLNYKNKYEPTILRKKLF